ncbi:MAG: S24 family peptidase [Nitrososphaerales archaeon]
MELKHEEKKSRLRHLRLLVYLLPILAIVTGYALIIVATQETYPFTIVTGTSMEPTIMPGSIAVIDRVPFNQLKQGDVIVFVPRVALMYSCDGTPGSSLTSEAGTPCFIIHRILSIQTDPQGVKIITTKGDNNLGSIPNYDTGINSSMYIGKVVLQFPIAGYVTVSPYNEYIAFVILVILVSQLLYERKHSKKQPVQQQQDQPARESDSTTLSPA